jgi:hypothetical protein
MFDIAVMVKNRHGNIIYAIQWGKRQNRIVAMTREYVKMGVIYVRGYKSISVTQGNAINGNIQ